jgi:hypothetical protein
MRILFVHQNFPGQFLHLAPALAQSAGAHGGQSQESGARPCRPLQMGATYIWGDDQRPHFRDRHRFVPDVVFGIICWGEHLS